MKNLLIALLFSVFLIPSVSFAHASNGRHDHGSTRRHDANFRGDHDSKRRHFRHRHFRRHHIRHHHFWHHHFRHQHGHNRGHR